MRDAAFRTRGGDALRRWPSLCRGAFQSLLHYLLAWTYYRRSSLAGAMASNDIVFPCVSERHPNGVVATTVSRVCENADAEPPRCLDVGSERCISRALLQSSPPNYGCTSRWSIGRIQCGRKNKQSSIFRGQCCALPGAGLGLTRGRQARLLETVNELMKRATERVPLGGVPFGGALLGRDDISRGQGLVHEDCVTEEDGSLQLEPRKRKKVLILMSDTGGGHRASAEAIKATFELEFGDEYKVTIIDLWQEYTPWPFNQVPKTYSFMVKHEALWKLAYHGTAPRFVHQSQMAATSTFIARLVLSLNFYNWIGGNVGKVREVTKGLLKYQPNVIVSVHPLMQHVPLRILRAKGLLNKIPFTTVITDLSTCHPTWFHRSVTKCFCPTKDVERRALKAGLHPSQLRVYGLPIRPAFSQATHSKAQLRKELELIDDLPAVLLMGGGEGMGPVEATAHALLESLYDKESRKPRGQLVVICGRNKKLVDKLESFEWTIPVKIQGFVTNMAHWMGACDCVITKAGPGTIAEAMISGLPMVLNSYIAGQEVGNVSFVVDNAAGKFSDKPTEIACIVAEWFGSKAVEFKAMAKNAAKLGRPDAVFKIVRDIDELARTRNTLEEHRFAYL